MRVVIVEAAHTGHRLTYVRQMLPSILDLGCDVTLVTSRDAAASDAFGVQIEPFADRIRVDSAHDALPRAPRSAFADAALGMLGKACAAHAPDVLMVPSGDGVAQAAGMARLRGKRVVPRGVFVQAGFHRGAWAYPHASRKQRLDASLNRRLLAVCPWDRFLFVDHLVHRDIARRGGSIAKRADLLPDPIDPAPEMRVERAREVLGIDPGVRVLGSSGVQDERKGVDHLVGAFGIAVERGDVRDSDVLLLAGRLSDGVRSVVASHQALVDTGRIVVIDRYLTDDELAASLVGVDVAAVCHPSHVGLSNIALRAAGCGRPVLASDFGWLGEMVPRFGLGRTCSVKDHASLAAAIGGALDEAGSFEPPEACEKLLAFHTRENFGKVWVAALRERMGHAPDDSAVRWSEVESAL